MASFAKLAVWPVGYFRAYSSWLLRNRREVASRIDVINAEVARIGFIRVYYRTVPDAEGQQQPTEVRIGFSVTRGSSLGKLLRAYIATGGNPLDISPFMYPDSTEIVGEDADGNPKVVQRYPYGGVAAPITAKPNEPQPTGGESGFGPYPGGYVRSDRYYPTRQGGRTDPGAFDYDTIVKTMHQIRGWANQDIKERVQEIEWRIIKLCDLREQLVRERDEVLVAAFGGVLTGVGELDEARFDPALRVQELVQDLYNQLYETEADGSVRSFTAGADVPFLKFTFEDTPSEINRDPLGC